MERGIKCWIHRFGLMVPISNLTGFLIAKDNDLLEVFSSAASSYISLQSLASALVWSFSI